MAGCRVVPGGLACVAARAPGAVGLGPGVVGCADRWPPAGLWLLRMTPFESWGVLGEWRCPALFLSLFGCLVRVHVPFKLRPNWYGLALGTPCWHRC
jgi:hypothetical protein